MRRLVGRAVVGPKDHAAVEQRLDVDVAVGTVQPQHATVRLAPGHWQFVTSEAVRLVPLTHYSLLTTHYSLLTTYYLPVGVEVEQ